MTPAIRVLLVDDHPVVRQGLRALLSTQDGIDVVGEAGDGEGAVAAAERLSPDVVLMDVVMPAMDGVEALRRIAETTSRGEASFNRKPLAPASTASIARRSSA